MTSIRFALYKGANGTLYHLQLLVRQRPLMHWVFPATVGQYATRCMPERGLLLEADTEESLTELVQQGHCQLASEPLSSTCSSLRAALAKGRLLLTLSGPKLQGTFSIIRLHETSPAWLMSSVSYLPSKQPVAPSKVAGRRLQPTATLRPQATGLA